MRARCVFVTLALLLLLSLPTAAQADELYEEQLAASGADTLTDYLPADTQELLESLQLDSLHPSSYIRLSLGHVLDGLLSLFSKHKGGAFGAFASLTGVVAVSSLFSGLEGTAQSLSLRQTYHSVAVLAAGSALLMPLLSLIEQVSRAVDSVAVFMAGYIPVYGVILAAGGAPTGAVSYQTTLLAAAELLTWLIRAGVFPVLLVSLAMGCTGAVADGFCLSSVSQTLYKGILWALGLLSTLFSWVLSLQQMVSAAADGLGSRAVKFSLSSLVPVVGGLLSEAYATVAGCAGLLRSTVGCFGLVAVVGIVLPPLISCICWTVSLSLSGTAAALFGLTPLETLCKTAAGAVRVLIAVLAVFALLMVVSTTVIVFSSKG